MTNDQTFNINNQFKSIVYDSDDDSWTFIFSDEIYVKTIGFWRLIKNHTLKVVSLDHGHQFGQPKPLDLIEIITKELTNKSLTRINVDKASGDLMLILTDNLELQIFISSTGYETYEFQVENKRYIGLGGGTDITIINNKQ
jgi:hypothetical protein